MKWHDHSGSIIDSKNGYDVIDCNLCNFKHIMPIPSSEKLEKYYRDEFVESKSMYVDKIIEDLAWWNLNFDEKYDILEQNLELDKRSLLDIGCGFGYFLKRGKQRGWNVSGIDPSKSAIEHAKSLGVDAECGLIDKNSFQEKQFNVIHMHEVIEHLPDPKKSLTIIHNILKNNGLLCISSPNDYNPLQLISKHKSNVTPWWVSPIDHINYFDFSSIKNLLNDVGFEIIYQSSSFPLELFLLMGENYVGDDNVGRFIHKKRINFELKFSNSKKLDLLRKIYQSFAELNIGREFVIIVRKKS